MAARYSSTLILALAVGLAAGAARAAVFDGDDRISFSRRSGNLYAPIGRILGDGRAGTGFLVGQCHVLTAQHNFSNRAPADGEAVIFQAVHARLGRSPPASRGTIVASGNFETSRQAVDWSEGRSRDWMLVRLDHCLGKVLGFVDLVDQAFRFDGADAPVRSAGFPIDRRSADALVLDPSCRIRSGNFREWLHDCAALPGNSGGPIFQELRSGGRVRLRVVAMVTSGEPGGQPRFYANATANRATKIAYILPLIAPFLDLQAMGHQARKGPGVTSRPFASNIGLPPSGGHP